jgi:hypothetical protein
MPNNSYVLQEQDELSNKNQCEHFIRTIGLLDDDCTTLNTQLLDSSQYVLQEQNELSNKNQCEYFIRTIGLLNDDCTTLNTKLLDSSQSDYFIQLDYWFRQDFTKLAKYANGKVQPNLAYPTDLRRVVYGLVKNNEKYLNDFLTLEEDILGMIGQPQRSSSLYKAASQQLEYLRAIKAGVGLNQFGFYQTQDCLAQEEPVDEKNRMEQRNNISIF